MQAKQLKKIKVRLEEMQAEILGESEETVQAMQQESTLFPDPNDRASLETEHINNLRIRDRERKLIKKIDKTLESIESDDYGFCETCGIEIGLRRLEARPTATQCVDCKTLDELREKQTGA